MPRTRASPPATCAATGWTASRPTRRKGLFGEDERKKLETEVQKLTDKTIGEIDAAATAKEKEILGK